MKRIMKEVKVPVRGMNRYILRIKHLGVFESQEEEYQCAMKMINGCEESRKTLVEKNLRFVPKVVVQYSRNEQHFDELVAEGNMGLYDATFKYDPSKGFKFISYAVHWIKMRIINCINNRHIISVTSRVSADMHKYKMELEQELQNNGGFLSGEFLEKNNFFAQIEKNIQSSNAVDDWNDIGKCMNPFQKIYEEDNDLILRLSLNILKEKEKRIVEKYFGIGCVQKGCTDIGYEESYSRTQIKNIVDKALKKMGDAYKEKRYLI